MSMQLLYRPVSELAALIRAGELSSSELVSASLERIESLDDQINAFVFVDPERALANAATIKRSDPRPFAGVPFAIKNLFTALAGVEQTQGSYFFGDYKPDYDNFFVRRLKQAGFVIVGVTNSSEFGVLPVTEPRRYGPTRNPWNLSLAPGGSSGGASAAVTAGMVPVAHATDAAGSIRNPASCCGLVGLKPSRNRISAGPDLGESNIVSSGVITRTVLETAQLLDVLAGYEAGDANWAPQPRNSFYEATLRVPNNLRIGILAKPPVQCEVDPVFIEACQRAAELFEGQGHKVEEVIFEWPEDLFDLFTEIYGAVIGGVISFGVRINGREPGEDEIEPLSRELYERAKKLNALKYQQAIGRQQSFARQIIGLCLNYDAIITPALAKRPVKIGAIDGYKAPPMTQLAEGLARFAPFTWVWNLTGQPAITLPLWEKEGLPISIQLVGNPAGEEQLLALAQQLEQIRNWTSQIKTI